ncbi:hypothetical protein AAFF_G00324300 [Aldrovandia affinis]|uniref:Uncharacterized protein n=1 Tax=Aldrovandia affinis TaxID=143900 RepID=A0AAD7R6X1_9TELE|nr:hypothetical protein AAFF_G00324300 [Aldrovandia affinis]
MIEKLVKDPRSRAGYVGDSPDGGDGANGTRSSDPRRCTSCGLRRILLRNDPLRWMPEGAQPFIKLCSGQLLDEFVEQKPMIADFKNRWPALFQVNEVDIDLKRDSILKSLCVYLNEDSEAFVKEYLDCTVSVAEEDMLQTVMGIYVVRKAGTKDNNAEDVGIVMEGVSVLNNLATVYNAFIMLFGLIYALDLSWMGTSSLGNYNS